MDQISNTIFCLDDLEARILSCIGHVLSQTLKETIYTDNPDRKIHNLRASKSTYCMKRRNVI